MIKYGHFSVTSEERRSSRKVGEKFGSILGG
jgi:hypothetical protein